MQRYWIGLLALALAQALLATGCKTIDTRSQEQKLQEFEQAYKRRSREESAYKEQKRLEDERKRQEQASKVSKAIEADPWKAQSYERVRELAKSNQVALFLIIRNRDGLLSVSGIDVANLEYGINAYGLPLVKGRLIESPDRKRSVAAYFATFTAICKTGILIDPANQVYAVKNHLHYARESYVPAIWQILCSNGTAFPAPVILDHAKRKQ